jgi:S1-C subfamily serine protease
MQYEKMKERDPRPSFLGTLPFIFIIALGIAACWWFFFHEPSSPYDPDATPRPVTARGNLAADELSTIELFEHVSPAVVHITTTTLQPKRSYLTLNIYEMPQGDGSGFVWDRDGHVVTNFHVIQNAQGFSVKFSDQSVYRARLVGAAPDKDIAVLHIDAPADKLHPIPVGRSSDLRVGQKVFAIGNPFGFDQSLSTGVVSALGREITSVTRKPISDVIQTDAAINPGNSGGPLLDSAGRLIGINTSIASPSRASAGVGFAVPVDTVNSVVPLIIQRGNVGRPGLGITVMPASRYGAQEGALILEVVGGSAAQVAGLRETWIDRVDGSIYFGDIILEINGARIKDSDALSSELARYNVGDEVTLTIRRNKENLRVPVTLQAID